MTQVPAPLTVAVLAGGRSSEHEVSLASGAAIADGLRAGGERVLAIEIGRDGVWRHEGRELSLRPGAGLLGVDVAFPALHGPFGEDGSVQGLLEMLDLPYVGAGVAASALCMDKVMFKRLMATAGLPQVAYLGVREQRWHTAREQVVSEVTALCLPVFVKPAHLGSSVGIVKASDPGEAAAALDAAFAHDELAIVEASAPGIEVECGVLALPRAAANGERPGGIGSAAKVELEVQELEVQALASEPGEVTYPGEFYDYEAKYTPGGMELIVPARISSRARARVMELALATFAQSGCEGLARVDFFVDGEQVLVNELNTMPGFTTTSVYAKLLAASGVPYPELLERLCRLGIERHLQRARRCH
jgi:D-alanine-D-alanine ligase